MATKAQIHNKIIENNNNYNNNNNRKLKHTMKFCPHFWAVVEVQGHIAQVYKTKGATCT